MSASADRNLLFGILAVQLDFVTKDALVAAMNTWLLDKARPLGDILRDQGHLSPERLHLLTALVAEHLKQHGGDPQRSLAALSSVPPTLKQQLAALPDQAVQQSLACVAAARPAVEPDPNLTVPQPPPPPNAVRYRVLRPHAKGGLGEVFVAEDTELGRSVALKEIQNRYADDKISRERFVREAEITGGLEHPGIVPVYGLGTYDDGRPFYAMRFIKGDNLKAAIRRFHNSDGSPPRKQGNEKTLARAAGSFDSLGFRQLLRRFIDVCNAVAYAHSRGVLHRDLKPGNIMLGKYGETLVVDWGLAKPTGRSDATTTDPDAEATLQPRSGGESSATVMGQAMGTPAYMSPEQAAGKLDDLGPATDIYSLGATLYELLTGGVPFAEVDLDAVQTGRFPPPRAVNPAVPRALEAVCLRAMALRPAERYGSALDVAKEVERWLADEPVTCWREPFGPRLRRWVRKHARLATGVGVALTVGLLAAGGLAWQREQARATVATKEAETARERDRALAARQRTREALDAMVSEVAGDSLTTQKALSPEQKKFLETVLKYFEEFAAEPGEDREGRERLAKAHIQLAIIRQRLGQNNEGVGVARVAVALYEKLAADYPAEELYRCGRAAGLNLLANHFATLGRRVDAANGYRAAVAVQEKLAADFPAAPHYRGDLAIMQGNLGVELADLGRRTEAEAAYRAARSVQEKLVAEFPAVPAYRFDLANTRNNLGFLFTNLGKWAEAEAEYRAALAMQVKLAADFPAVPNYRAELANTYNNLSNLLYDLGRHAESEAPNRSALAVFEKLATDFPAVPEHRRGQAATRADLGLRLSSLGKHADAEGEFRAALAMYEKLVADFPSAPAHRRGIAVCHLELGNLFVSLGKQAAAEAEYRTAVAEYEKLAADFPAVQTYVVELAGIYVNFGTIILARGDASAALDWHAKAIDRLAPINAAEPRLALSRQILSAAHVGRANGLNALHRHSDALADWDRAIELGDGPARAALRCNRAERLARLGRVAEAIAVADELAKADDTTGETLYGCACVFAISAAPANNAAAAARAVEVLRQAVAKGFANIPHLLADADLAPLRRRDDYVALLWDLADTPAAVKP